VLITRSLSGDFNCLFQLQVEKYIASRDYKSRKPDELEFKKGDCLEILEKNFNGWWKARLNDQRQGIVPAVYLRKFHAADPVMSAANAWDLFGSRSDLLFLPPSRNDFVGSFSSASSSDSSFSSGDVSQNSSILVLDDNHSSCSYKVTMSPTSNDVYYVSENFDDNSGDCVRLIKGQRVFVLDRENSSGWWYVKIEDGTEGWAPGGFLNVR
jgi:hypothetical protein